VKYSIVFTDDFSRQFKELKKKYSSEVADLSILLAELQDNRKQANHWDATATRSG